MTGTRLAALAFLLLGCAGDGASRLAVLEHRLAGPRLPSDRSRPPVAALEPDLGAFRAAFDASSGQVRLVMLLSPT